MIENLQDELSNWDWNSFFVGLEVAFVFCWAILIITDGKKS